LTAAGAAQNEGVIAVPESEAWSPLEQFLEEQRRAQSQREESFGPLAAAVGMLRESCATTRLLLDELESSLVSSRCSTPWLHRRHGNRWWEDLTRDDGPYEELG
jgi:hypothetical protein